MMVRLLDAQPGDRFLGRDGLYWTVLSIVDGVVSASSPGRGTFRNMPGPGDVVEVINRDDSLTNESAIGNLLLGGVTGRIIE